MRFLLWCLVFVVHLSPSGAIRQQAPTVPERPQLVLDCLAKNEPLYYFGVGSNLSRKKLEERSRDGSKIEILRMEPALVENHRLAFNLRGFPPLEPGMGSLEPCPVGESHETTSKPLFSYERPECHGALVQLTPENYERVMKSEGIDGRPDQGYDEIVVTAIPYDQSRTPVKAIALRARSHVRLRQDPCPSIRYMNILREGAEELQLKPSYQQFLADHPVQKVPLWLRKLAVYNFVVTGVLSFKFKFRLLSKIQSFLMFRIYVPSNRSKLLQVLSHFGSALILLPTAVVGFLLFSLLKLTNKVPPMMSRFLAILDDPPERKSTNE